MTTVTIEEAQAKLLPEIIHQMSFGEELVITENQQPVAKLVSEHEQPKLPAASSRPRLVQGGDCLNGP